MGEEEGGALVPCLGRWGHRAGNQQEALNKAKLIHSVFLLNCVFEQQLMTFRSPVWPDSNKYVYTVTFN